jgi:hypothetical protein
VSFNFLEA